MRRGMFRLAAFSFSLFRLLDAYTLLEPRARPFSRKELLGTADLVAIAVPPHKTKSPQFKVLGSLRPRLL